MADTANDTVINGLKKLFPQVSSLLLAQDAQVHAKFIQSLMGAIQQYLTTAAQSTIQGGGGQPSPQAGQPGQGPVSGPPAGGPPPEASGMPPAPGAIPSGGGMQGLAGAISRNPDEIRRLLTSTTNP